MDMNFVAFLILSLFLRVVWHGFILYICLLFSSGPGSGGYYYVRLYP